MNCFSCYALYVAYDAMKVPCCLLLVLWHAAVILTQIGDDAEREGVELKLYTVIYDAIDDLKKEVAALKVQLAACKRGGGHASEVEVGVVEDDGRT